MIMSTNKKQIYPCFNAANPIIIHSFRKNFKKLQQEQLLMADYLLVQKINSFKKMKFVFFSNFYIYITKNNSLSQRINFTKITNVINATMSGEIAILVDQKEDIIIDSMEHKLKIIEILQQNLKHTYQYINVMNTVLQPYLRKDTSQKIFIKQHGKNMIDLRKMAQIDEFNKGDIKKYTFFDLLGEGEHGKTYYTVHTVTKLPYAVKSFRKENYIKNPELLKKAITAIQFQEKVKSTSLCRLVQTFYTKTRTYIVMEYISNYNLQKVIAKRGHLPQDYLKILLAEVASSLSIIHDAGYVYNNLKLTHVVIDGLGHTKLIDFFETIKINSKKQGQKKFKQYQYAPPDELLGKPLMPTNDWWQLGILAYQLMFQSTPFLDDTLQTLLQNIKNKQPNFQKPNCNNYSEKALDFAKSLLKKKVTDRLGSKNGFLQIMKHPFMEELKPSLVMNRKIQTCYHIKSYKRQMVNEQSFCQENAQLNAIDEQLERFVYDCRLQQ